MNTDDSRFELIRRCRDGAASPEEFAQLESYICGDADFREAYLRYINLDVALSAAAKTAPMSAITTNPSRRPRNVWLQWRPFTAAAAGLVIGVFSASAVWAFAATKIMPARELPLVDGTFEQSAGDPPLYMPRKFGLWAGDPVAIISEFEGIKPHSGQRMVRYLAGAMREQDRAQNGASDLWQIIPLAGSGERVVRIRAWFNAVGPASFTLGAVAGADGPETAHTLWNSRLKDDSSVLAASMKTVRLSDQTPGWQMAELLLQVPGPARVLVIDVAAHRMPGVKANDGFPGQFVDDVRVTLVDERAGQ